jgi:hypothetical protein
MCMCMCVCELEQGEALGSRTTNGNMKISRRVESNINVFRGREGSST